MGPIQNPIKNQHAAVWYLKIRQCSLTNLVLMFMKLSSVKENPTVKTMMITEKIRIKITIWSEGVRVENVNETSRINLPENGGTSTSRDLDPPTVARPTVQALLKM